MTSEATGRFSVTINAFDEPILTYVYGVVRESGAAKLLPDRVGRAIQSPEFNGMLPMRVMVLQRQIVGYILTHFAGEAGTVHPSFHFSQLPLPNLGKAPFKR